MKIILFDGVCHFCNATVNYLLKHDKEKLFYFSPQQSEQGRALLIPYGREDTELNALIFIDEDELLEGIDAAIGISKYLKGFPSLFYLLRFLPRRVTQAAYAIVARNRYRWFGKRETCRMPEPGEQQRFLV